MKDHGGCGGKQPVTMNPLIPTFAALLALPFLATADSVGTAFTYQGRLDQNGAPASGSFDLKFERFDVSANGQPLGAALEFPARAIVGGLISVDLDFGGPAVFDGTAYWLQISARAAGAPAYVPVPGRTPIRPTPYAIHALSAAKVRAGAVTSSGLANAAVTSAKLAPASVGVTQLSPAAAPELGQVLGYDGAALSWITPPGAGAGGGPWLSGSNANIFYNGGNVGIGTIAPGHALGIAGPLPGWTSNQWGGAVELTNASAIGWQSNAAGSRFGIGQSTGGLYFFRTASDPGTLASPAVYDMFINDGGNVVMTGGGPGFFTVGSPNGDSGHSIQRNGNRADVRFDGSFLRLVAGPGNGPPSKGIAINTISSNVSISGRLETASQDAARFYGYQPFFTFMDSNEGNALSRIQGHGGKLSFWVSAPFSGLSHAATMDLTGMQISGDFRATGNVSARSLTIRGGADLAEPFAMSHEGIEPGSVVVIDEKNPGKLKLSTSAYDKKVAGIVSGANGIGPGISMIEENKLEPGENVALSGRVYVKAVAAAGAIEPGDLLTTSSTAGHAMKAAEQSRAQGAILGKAMTSLSEDAGLVLVLVTLQ